MMANMLYLTLIDYYNASWVSNVALSDATAAGIGHLITSVEAIIGNTLFSGGDWSYIQQQFLICYKNLIPLLLRHLASIPE